MGPFLEVDFGIVFMNKCCVLGYLLDVRLKIVCNMCDSSGDHINIISMVYLLGFSHAVMSLALIEERYVCGFFCYVFGIPVRGRFFCGCRIILGLRFASTIV